MAEDTMPELRALHAAAERVVRDREAMTERVLTDPVAYAVAHIVRAALESRQAHDRTILDATVAVMAIVDPAEARGRAGAIGDLRNEPAYRAWLVANHPLWCGDYTAYKPAAYLEESTK